MKTFAVRVCLVVLCGILLSTPAVAQDSLNMSCESHLYDFWQWAYDVQVVGSHAYLAASTAGLIILDVSDPANPVPIGHYDCGIAKKIVVRGDYAYIAGNSRFDILNIADPAHPVSVGWCPLEHMAVDLAVSGNRAMVAMGIFGLWIGDISNPQDPHLLSIYLLNDSSSVTCVAASGMYAYVGEIDFSGQPVVGGMRVLNVTNPNQPVPVGYLADCAPRKIAVSGNHAYIAYVDLAAFGWTGLVVADITNPAAPVEVGYWDLIDGRLDHVSVSGNLACVSDQYSGLHIINISNPTQPVEVGLAGEPMITTISGNFLYGVGSSVHIFDLSTPSDPDQICDYDNTSHLNAVMISDSLAYISDGSYGLRVVNVANPIAPVEIGRCSIPGHYLGTAVFGNYVYVVDELGTDGIHVVDVTDPTLPTVVNHWTEARQTCDIAIAGNFAYVPDSASLLVLDISDPVAPQQIAQLPGLPGARIVTLTGQIACIGPVDYPESRAICFVDISDPAHPDSVGVYLLPNPQDNLQAISAVGHHVFVSFLHNPNFPVSRLAILDISIPSAPVEEVINTPWNAVYDMVAVDSSALLTCDNSGIHLWNTQDPENLVELGYYETPGSASALAVQGQHVFVAEDICFGIYDMSVALPVQNSVTATPSAFSLFSPYPNPFNPATTISFSLSRTGETTLAIYDVTGRLVRTLFAENLTAGEHHLELNGASLPSGIYFARLTANGVSQTRKLVLLK